MVHDEFKVPAVRQSHLAGYIDRIEHLFGVKVEFLSDNETIPAPLRQGGSSALLEVGQVDVIVVKVSGQNVDQVLKAKEYVLNVTTVDVHNQERVVSEPVVSGLSTAEYEEVEKRTGAVLELSSGTGEVCVGACSLNVSMAEEALAQLQVTPSTELHHTDPRLHNASSIGCNDLPVHSCFNGPNDHKDQRHDDPDSRPPSLVSAGLSSALSPGMESNPDSCYDSDTSSVGSRRNSSHLVDLDVHMDIRRTSSDTLAAEHPDNTNKKLCIMSAGLPSHIPVTMTPSFTESPPEDPSESPQLMSNTEYAGKVEYGLRLGYNEDQILSALNKVGYKVSEDELLNELILLGDVPGEMEKATEEEDVTVSSSIKPAKATLTDCSEPEDDDELRPIVIDGSNVAMSHGNKDVFSCMGIRLAVEWFRERCHKEITVFVPTWRKEASRPDTLITDQEVLLELERDNVVVFTPARRVGGKRVICYDDRYIIKLAAENGGIVVSNDNYRDLIEESPDYKKVVEERLLMYSFVNDRFMPPDDPLGRYGPGLDDFLRKNPRGPRTLPPICPYGKKCTYGNKCKYYHPERGQQPVKLVTERIVEKARKAIKEVKEKGHLGSGEKKTKGSSDQPIKKTALTRSRTQMPAAPKQTLSRTQSLHPGHSTHRGAPIPLSQFMTPSLDDSTSSKETTSQVHVSVTPDPEEYARYNDKLSELRRKVEEADADEQTRLAHDTSEPIPRMLEPGNRDTRLSDSASKHWSQMHHSLRPVDSDPPMSFTGGHLALAKKLSDEGKLTDEETSLVGRGLSPNHKSATEQKQSTEAVASSTPVRHHRALNRQLSLKGSDDPRLTKFNIKSAKPKEETQRGKTSAISSQVFWPLQTASMTHSQSMTLASSMNHTLSTGHVHNILEKHVSCPISETSVISREGSPRMDKSMADLTLDQSRPLHYTLSSPSSKMKSSIPHHVQAEKHYPIQRLRSDPLMQPMDSHGRVMPVKYPTMNRQNSTSDPQLNVYHEDHMTGVYAMNNNDMHHHEMLLRNLQHNVPGIPSHMRTAPNSPHAPLSPHFGPPVQNLQFTLRGSAAGLQHKTSSPNLYSYSTTSQGSPTLHKTSGITTPGCITPGITPPYSGGGMIHQGGHPNSHRFFLQSQAESPSSLVTHDMSKPPPLFSHSAQDLSMPPPPIIHPGEANICVRPPPPPHHTELTVRAPAPHHNTGEHLNMRPTYPGPQANVHIPPSQTRGPSPHQMINVSTPSLQAAQQVRGPSPLHHMPGPNLQEPPPSISHSDVMWKAMAEGTRQDPSQISVGGYRRITQSDPRYNTYYHLCALFKEDDVLRVMTENPEETNPQVLCKYLI